jgi:hypothetical protein
MSNHSSPEQAIKREFETYYLADELEKDWVKDIPKMAKFTAHNLRSSIGDKQISEAIVLLNLMRNDFEHPLVQAADLSHWTDWEDEPEEWAKFQMLLDQIAINLEKTIQDNLSLQMK